MKERLAQKPGWDYEPTPPTVSGRVLKPDVGAPVRNPAKPTTRKQMELKPDTPSGRRAAERAARHYKDETGNQTRGIFYDPKDFI